MNNRHWFWGNWRPTAAIAALNVPFLLMGCVRLYDNIQLGIPIGSTIGLLLVNAFAVLLNGAVAYSLYLKEQEESGNRVVQHDEWAVTYQYEDIEEEVIYRKPGFLISWKLPTLLAFVALLTLLGNISFWANNLTADIPSSIKSLHGSLLVVHTAIILVCIFIAVGKYKDEN